jgi:hypothetical protein
VLLTESPSCYTECDHRIADVGGVLLKTVTWGVITERRLVLTSGLEVEVGIGTPAWASVDPLDGGTRHVVTDGMRRYSTPNGLLSTRRDL